MTLKVLSWNIWIDSNEKDVERFLKEASADIVGLQEVQDNKPERDIISWMSTLGYKHIFAPAEKGWGGNVWRDGPAVFSKHEIVSSEAFILSEPEKRAAARADIKIGNTVLHIFSTHLIHTHQMQSDLQEEQTKNLLKLLPSENTIVMGDFNAAPESAAIKMMLGALIDVDASSQPTWSVHPAGCVKCNPQKIDTRLDYIFVTPDIKYHSFKVEDSKASDHLPISVEIEV